MGFFETLGRKVGEVTHEAKQTAAEQATHGCTDCGKRLYTDQSSCPECGSEAIVEIEGTSAEHDRSTDETDADSSTDGAEHDRSADTQH